MSFDYRFGLVGQNISYSRSSDIFKAIFEIQSIKGSFENFSLGLDNFDTDFRRIINSGVKGLSVTIPYKNRVIELLDDIAPIAKALQAVNSIAITEKGLLGYNTDCYGFSLPLRDESERLKHSRALVLGCGGAAKAVVYALYTDYEVKRFTVLSRSQNKLRLFQESLADNVPGIDLDLKLISDSNLSGQFDIAVNCTPAGGWNQPEQSPLPDKFNWEEIKLYYDLNYNKDNPIVELARTKDIKTIDGSAMLVGQALRSFRYWTGEEVSFDDVYHRVFGD